MSPHEEVILLNEPVTVMIVPFGGGMVVSLTALWALWWLGLTWLWMFASTPIVWALTYVNLQLADGLRVVVAISVSGTVYMAFRIGEMLSDWEKARGR